MIKYEDRKASDDAVRADANSAIKKAQAGSASSDKTKTDRRERLTKYPPSVREARNQNHTRNPDDEQRDDESDPGS